MKKHLISPLALAVLACTHAHAHQHEQLQPVLVTGSAQRSALDEAAGSSSRLGLSLRETPASVTVVGRDEIERRAYANTQEVLKSVPGVVFADPPGSAGTVFYRGFGSGSLSQLYNGISVQYDAIAARPLDSWLVERVEAIGGASSFLNGSGAVGGTINVISKIADRGGDISRLRLGLGDRGAQGSASLQRSLGEQVLRVELNRNEGALWTQGSERSAWQASASWLAPLSAGVTHTLAVERQHEQVMQPYWGTPMLRAADGTVPAGQLHFDAATMGVNYNALDGRYQQDVSWARSILEWKLNDRTRLSHTLYLYDALRDYENVETYVFKNDNSAVERRDALLQRHDQRVWGSRTELSHGSEIAGLRSDFAAGIDWSFNRQTRFPLSVPGPFGNTDPYQPAASYFYSTPGIKPGYNPGASNLLRSFALFVENRTVLGGGYALVSALRWDRIALDVRNHRTVTATNPALFTTDFKPLTGRLGLVKDLSKDWQVYAQASSAADPPSGVLATAGFSALRRFELTRGRQVEIGSKLAFDQGRGQATLALYDLRRKNFSITDPNDSTNALPVGAQSSRGAEFSLKWRPSAQLNLSGQLSHTRARYQAFTEGTVSRAGQTPANVPTWVAGAALDWQPLQSLGLGLDWRHVGKRYANVANTVWDGAYNLVGASATFKIDRQTTLQARVDNLGDERYVASLSSNLPYLGAPRSLSLAVDWKF